MKSQYMIKGSTVWVGNELDLKVEKNLPVGTYTVSFDVQRGFYLQRVADFTNPSKLYGNCKQMAERFLNTFKDRNGTTGVLLAGEKGSGKSLVMKVTSTLGLERGISTLIVNANYYGELFNNFIASIQDEAIIIFDEFEKVYSAEDQEKLLTLLDGTMTTRKLVIMTCNDRYKINQHMNNRPGRLFYNLNYSGLSKEFIVEYCNDVLKADQRDKIESICTLAALFRAFNFDMLKSLVEELNRYGETVRQAVEILNIKMDYSHRTTYDVEIIDPDGNKVEKKLIYPQQVNSPLANDHVLIYVYPDEEAKDNEDEDDTKVIRFPIHASTTQIKPDLSEIKCSQDQYKVVLTKSETTYYNVYDHVL